MMNVYLPRVMVRIRVRVAVDLFELDVHYLLTMDYYSGFQEIRSLSSTRAESVISVLKAMLWYLTCGDKR